MKSKGNQVHRSRFVHYQPATINAIDFTPPTVKNALVAVGRANGDIEIWSPVDVDYARNQFNLVKTIPGGEDLSIECIAWAHQSVICHNEDDTPEQALEQLKEQLAKPPRLFSSGMNHTIVEWDMESMTVKRTADSPGGTILSLVVNSQGTKLAAACQDGTAGKGGVIRLFDIEDGVLQYTRSFQSMRHRILSLAWAPNDEYIVSGGDDSAIRKWHVETGASTARMTVEKKAREHTLVWAVLALKNKTIVSGDSLGNIMFWDAVSGTRKESFRAHEADILALASNAEDDLVVSAGVDRKLVMSTCNTDGSPRRWAKKMEYKNHHNHDIRSLAIDKRPGTNTVISGGVDTEILATALHPHKRMKEIRQLPVFPRKYAVTYSLPQKLLMATFSNSISLWHLTEGVMGTESVPGKEPGYEHVLKLALRPTCNITSSALSANGDFIAVADIETVRLFRVETDGTLWKLQKVRSFEKGLHEHLASRHAATGAHHVVFTPGSDRLIVVTVESRVLVIDLRKWEEGAFEVLREFGHHSRLVKSQGGENEGPASVLSVAVSSDGQWLCTGDELNRIHVFNLDSLKHHIKLPTPSMLHTVLSFSTNQPSELCVVVATNEFFIYDVEQQQQTPWSKIYSDELSRSRLCNLRDRIRGVMYNPGKKGTIYFYGSRSVIRVDMQIPRSLEGSQKRTNDGETLADKARSRPIYINTVRKYEQLLFGCYLARKKLLLVEQPKKSILEGLPPTFKVKEFGT